MSINYQILEYAKKNMKNDRCIIILRKQFVKCCSNSDLEDHIAYEEKYTISDYITDKDIQIIKKYNNLEQYDCTDISFRKLEKLLFKYGYICKIIMYNQMLNLMSPTYYIFIEKIVSKL